MALLLGAGWCAPALAAELDPNQIVSFKKIVVEPPKDNVDGAFRAPVEQSYKEIFDRNPRFEMVGDRSEADSAVRTTVTKKTSGIDIEVTLVVLGTGEVFSTDRTTIAPNATGSEAGTTVKAILKTALKRIPFYGTVTGRDQQELTFDIGAAHGLKRGDIVQLSRVDQIKRHPLLKAIVDVQMVPVGSAVVENVEDTIAFAKVHSEIAGEAIRRFYKVTAIEARAPDPPKERPREDGSFDQTLGRAEDSDQDRPELGYVDFSVLLGVFSSSTSQLAGTSNFAGSAFNPGFRFRGELWLTKRWFADLSFGASTMSYEQSSTAVLNPPERPGASASTRSFGISAGYKYLPNGDIRGSQVYVKLGYHSFTWSVPVVPADLQSPKSYSGLNLGLGGTLPLTSYDWGLMLNINVLLFPSLTEEGFNTGGAPSASGANFFLGAYHHLTPRVALRAGMQFDIYSADFGEGSSQSSTSQKNIGFLPSIVYYF